MNKRIALSAALIILLLSLNRFFQFSDNSIIKEAAGIVAYPFVRVTNTVSSALKKMAQRAKSYDELKQECEKLHEEKDELFVQNVALHQTVKKGRLTRDLRRFKRRYQLRDAHVAGVIARTIDDNEQTLFVDKGSRDGIVAGQPVIYKHQLVGSIKEVFFWYSTVKLITDFSSKVSAVTRTSNDQGIVQGTNTPAQLLMNYVSNQASVTRGDIALSSGQGLVYPQGFSLGKITAIEQEELYHRIALTPLVDLTTLPYCLIIERKDIEGM